ncbi:MAG: hypothetical protein QW254_05280 [Desulfurococcaceae archaeon]
MGKAHLIKPLLLMMFILFQAFYPLVISDERSLKANIYMTT